MLFRVFQLFNVKKYIVICFNTYCVVGSSCIYYWPGYWAFSEKPAYHNKDIVSEGANITVGQQAIDETLSYLVKDEKLNFMVVYVDAPDEVGHSSGPHSTEVYIFYFYFKLIWFHYSIYHFLDVAKSLLSYNLMRL